MNKIPGYDEATPSYGIPSKRLPLANYICKIIRATEHEKQTKDGISRSLKIEFDIADGELQGFYAKQYEASCANAVNSDKAINWPWDAVYFVSLNESNVNRLKGFMKCLEKSNRGFEWNWDESKLAGLKFAGNFVAEENEYNGKTYVRTKLANVYPVDEFDSMPEPYTRSIKKNDNPFENGNSGAYYGASAWNNVPPQAPPPQDSEIPF